MIETNLIVDTDTLTEEGTMAVLIEDIMIKDTLTGGEEVVISTGEAAAVELHTHTPPPSI